MSKVAQQSVCCFRHEAHSKWICVSKDWHLFACWVWNDQDNSKGSVLVENSGFSEGRIRIKYLQLKHTGKEAVFGVCIVLSPLLQVDGSKTASVELISPSGNKFVAVERKFYICCFGKVMFHSAINTVACESAATMWSVATAHGQWCQAESKTGWCSWEPTRAPAILHTGAVTNIVLFV